MLNASYETPAYAQSGNAPRFVHRVRPQCRRLGATHDFSRRLRRSWFRRRCANWRRILGRVRAGRHNWTASRRAFGRSKRFRTCPRVSFLFEAFAVAIPAFGLGDVWLIASSFVVGAFVTGTVPLVLGRIGELLPHHPAQQKTAWSTATVLFALFQASAAYALSFVFAWSGGNYRLLFLIGAAAILLALAIDLIAAVLRRSSSMDVGTSMGSSHLTKKHTPLTRLAKTLRRQEIGRQP